MHHDGQDSKGHGRVCDSNTVPLKIGVNQPATQLKIQRGPLPLAT